MKGKAILLGLVLGLLLVPVGSGAVTSETLVFPSPASAVIGSVGHVNANEAGYFWSAVRGDSVAETLSTALAAIDSATLNLNVGINVLNSGAKADWSVSINGTDIGTFTVKQGEIGAKTVSASFPDITGPSYAVKIRMTNTVAGGQGSHTLTYNGSAPHSIVLSHANTCDDTANPNVDETGPISGPVHDTVEPAAGDAGGTVHQVNCEVVVANGL